MNRIQTCFQNAAKAKHTVFTAYLTMGFPSLEGSVQAVDTLIDNGADIIEFGVPFSDPMADGPVIRKAGAAALAQGVNLVQILAAMKELRARHPDTPFVLFSYYNVMFRLGLGFFADLAKENGVDAVLAVDVPMEDRQELLDVLRPRGMTLVPLIAPTTDADRIRQIAEGLEDSFLYTITVKGVTGVRNALPADLDARLREVKGAVKMPVVAGFGVSTREQAEAIGAVCDGFVIGSAIVRILDENPGAEGLAKLAAFAAQFR